MKRFLIILASLYFWPISHAIALDISPTPECFNVVNTAPYTVMGSVITDFFTNPDGKKARHTSNFRLEKKGARHAEEGYPVDRAEFCSTGPFLPGHKLRIVLRTLIPIFECETRIDQGDIVITGHRKPEGGTVTTATCYN